MAPRLDVVGLIVQDMAASLAFYRRLGFAFACDSPTEVDELHHELVAAGYRGHLEPWDAFWGQRYASIHDPDGNAIELFASLATRGT